MLVVSRILGGSSVIKSAEQVCVSPHLNNRVSWPEFLCLCFFSLHMIMSVDLHMCVNLRTLVCIFACVLVQTACVLSSKR